MKTFKEFLNEAVDEHGIEWKKDKELKHGIYQVHHAWKDGKHLGSVEQHMAYQDKKSTGSRIVSSRKEVIRWQANNLNPHTSTDISGRALTHAETGAHVSVSTYARMGHPSIKSAKESFVKIHKNAGHL